MDHIYYMEYMKRKYKIRKLYMMIRFAGTLNNCYYEDQYQYVALNHANNILGLHDNNYNRIYLRFDKK